MLAQQLAAVRQAQAGDRAVVLDRDRDAGERARVAGPDLLRAGERSGRVDLDEGAEAAVEFLDPLERMRDELAR